MKKKLHLLSANAGPTKRADPAKGAGQAGQVSWMPSARVLRWAIPSTAFLGQVWSRGIAPSPDRTAKMAFFVALGLLRFVSESRTSRWVELVETSRRHPLKRTMSFTG